MILVNFSYVQTVVQKAAALFSMCNVFAYVARLPWASQVPSVNLKQNKLDWCFWRGDKKLHICGAVPTKGLFIYFVSCCRRGRRLPPCRCYICCLWSLLHRPGPADTAHTTGSLGDHWPSSQNIQMGKYEVGRSSNVSAAERLSTWRERDGLNSLLNIYAPWHAGGIPWQSTTYCNNSYTCLLGNCGAQNLSLVHCQ